MKTVEERILEIINEVYPKMNSYKNELDRTILRTELEALVTATKVEYINETTKKSN